MLSKLPIKLTCSWLYQVPAIKESIDCPVLNVTNKTCRGLDLHKMRSASARKRTSVRTIRLFGEKRMAPISTNMCLSACEWYHRLYSIQCLKLGLCCKDSRNQHQYFCAKSDAFVTMSGRSCLLAISLKAWGWIASLRHIAES